MHSQAEMTSAVLVTLVRAHRVNVTAHAATEAWDWCEAKVSVSDIIKM